MPLMAMAAGCSGYHEISPEDENISGPLGEYFCIVDRPYKVKNGVVNIEFERIAEGMPEPWEKGMKVGVSYDEIKPGFKVEFIDMDDDIVGTDESDIIYDGNDLNTLVSLNVGETSIISFDVSGKKIEYFRVKSTFEYNTPSGSRSSSEYEAAEEDSASQDGSSDWDNVLDKYEDFVDRYVSTYKKAMGGDLSALTEYSDLLEKAQDLSEELDDATDEMTSSQLSRYMEITSRMTTDIL